MSTTPNQSESAEQHIRNLTGQLIGQSRIKSKLVRDNRMLREEMDEQAQVFHQQLDVLESALADVATQIAIARSITRRPR